MVGLVAFDLVLGFVLIRVMDVSFVIDVLYVHLDDSPADPPGLRVPAHTVTDLESFHHFSTSENDRGGTGDRSIAASSFRFSRSRYIEATASTLSPRR